MRYAFIQASLEDSELKDIPIAKRKRCEVLEVSVSGYHAWVKRQRMPVKCKKVISDETVLKQAKIIRNEMKYTPGYRQMHALMRQRGVCIGVKRLRGVLRVFACQRHHRVPSFQTYRQNNRQQTQHVCLSQPLRTQFCSRNTQQSMGERHHVLTHGPRLGVLGNHFGSWESPHSWLSIWLYVRAVATLLRERSCTRIEARSIVLLLSKIDLCNWT